MSSPARASSARSAATTLWQWWSTSASAPSGDASRSRATAQYRQRVAATDSSGVAAANCSPSARRTAVERAEVLRRTLVRGQRLGRALRQPGHRAGLGGRWIPGELRWQRQPLVQPGEAGREHRADREVRVGAGVEALDLGVGGGGPLPGGPRDQAQRGLAVLQAPALVGAGPLRGHQPQVPGRAGAAQHQQLGQRVEDPGEEALGLGGQTVRPGAAVAEVALAAPEAEVQVPAVADRARLDHRREGDPQAVPGGHGPDGVPDQDGGVRGADRALGGDRDLELARGVLGVDLQDAQPLRAEGTQDVPQVVGEVGEPVHPVRGAVRGVLRLLLRGAGEGDHPLDLDGGLEAEPAPGMCIRDRPLAARVRGAGLGVPVPRGPGPAGLGGQRDDPLQVGVEPEVPGGAADDRAGGDRVVGEEDVEAGRGADAPLRGVRQRGQWHGLDPGDARVVHPGDGHRLDRGGAQPVGGRIGALGPFGARGQRDGGRGVGGAGRLGGAGGGGSGGHVTMLPRRLGLCNSPIGWSGRTTVRPFTRSGRTGPSTPPR